jgi:hypothetical protein
MSDGERRRRFDVLFASYSSDVVAYCSWRAASASDAQDAVAEVFLTAWRRLEELPEGDAALPASPDPEETLVHEALRTARGRLHGARRRFRAVFEELSGVAHDLPARRPRAAIEGGS